MYTLHSPSGEVIKTADKYADLSFRGQAKGCFVSTDKPQDYKITILWNEGWDVNKGKEFTDLWYFAAFCAFNIPHTGIGYTKVKYKITVNGKNEFIGRLDITERMSSSILSIYNELCNYHSEHIETCRKEYFLPKAS